jgi:hypothetical protein
VPAVAFVRRTTTRISITGAEYDGSAAGTEVVPFVGLQSGISVGRRHFVDGTPRLGRPDFELRFGRASWRFANEGNMAAFAADPDVYAPRFGGHDPVAIVRGAATPGHPALWLIAASRLYLFYGAEARTAFASDPASGVEAAERYWPDVRRSIPR